MIIPDPDTSRRTPVLEKTARVVPEPCPPSRPAAGRAVESCAMVVFGGAGDLARRKLIPALYNLFRDGLLPKKFALVGTGRTKMTAEEFRAKHREATGRFSRTGLDAATWEKFAPMLDYVAGDYNERGLFERLRDWHGRAQRERGVGEKRLFYCSTPASGFPEILRGLTEANLVERCPRGTACQGAVVIEKPFGEDLATARQLDALIAERLDERQIFRIDHYLGKETVQNILVFRFGNTIFEPLWNRKYIDHVQVTVAESIGLEGRGKFYDETGALRDIVHNHLLQILAMCTMEAPSSLDAEELRDQKAHLLRSLRRYKAEEVPSRVVLGQYRGYRDEPNVPKDSRTETYAALEVLIDNWRWHGVPFYLRTGKRLAKRVTEVSIQFREIPLCLFTREPSCHFEPNVLCLRIQPDEGITLRFAAKQPGDALVSRNVTMDFSYARAFDAPVQEAYERLLLDAMRGDPTLFWRRDEAELAWEFITPILEAARARPDELIRPYEPGSAGPKEADALLARRDFAWRPLA